MRKTQKQKTGVAEPTQHKTVIGAQPQVEHDGKAPHEQCSIEGCHNPVALQALYLTRKPAKKSPKPPWMSEDEWANTIAHSYHGRVLFNIDLCKPHCRNEVLLKLPQKEAVYYGYVIKNCELFETTSHYIATIGEENE